MSDYSGSTQSVLFDFGALGKAVIAHPRPD